MMAINPNEDLKNQHLLAMGMSGSGKTYFIRNHPIIKRRGVRLVAFDAYETHDVNFSKSMAGFHKNFVDAVKSGKSFRLGLSVSPTVENFEKFCRLIWAAADGNKELVVIIGELADVASSGKASEFWGRLVRVGRKYGVILFAETQRPQEIDKTIFTQAGRKWVGYLEPYDHAYVEKNVGLEKMSLSTIEVDTYEHFYKHGSSIQRGTRNKKVKI